MAEDDIPVVQLFLALSLNVNVIDFVEYVPLLIVSLYELFTQVLIASLKQF